MREKLNCPNCGAPITDTQCPYCGAMLYDFAVLNDDGPTYIRMKWNGHTMTFRAFMRSIDLKICAEELPDLDINFGIIPDKEGTLLRQEQ